MVGDFVEHALKTDPVHFDDIVTGKKSFELRLNDRGYSEGDKLILKRTRYSGSQMASGAELDYTGEVLVYRVEHIVANGVANDVDGLAEGFVLMSIKPWISPADFLDVIGEPRFLQLSTGTELDLARVTYVGRVIEPDRAYRFEAHLVGGSSLFVWDMRRDLFLEKWKRCMLMQYNPGGV